MLCFQEAFIGELLLNPVPNSMPPRCTSYEDDYASNGEPGLANFATALLSPLEGQGRGFLHGHTKVMGVPHTAKGKLRDMFEQEDQTLREILQCAQEELLRCTATIMYDSSKARQGKARQGRQGKARQGKARQGKARQGKARQGK